MVTSAKPKLKHNLKKTKTKMKLHRYYFDRNIYRTKLENIRQIITTVIQIATPHDFPTFELFVIILDGIYQNCTKECTLHGTLCLPLSSVNSMITRHWTIVT